MGAERVRAFTIEDVSVYLGRDYGKGVFSSVTANARLSFVISDFLIVLSEQPTAASVVDLSHYDLRSSGIDGVFGSEDDERYSLGAGFDWDGRIMLSIWDGPLQLGQYRLSISGLTNSAGDLLDPQFIRFFSVVDIPGMTLETRSNDVPQLAVPIGTAGRKPDGTFQAIADLGWPGLCVQGFFNDDTNRDVVVVRGDGLVALFGNADGTFREGPRYEIGEPLWNAMQTADLDKDGNADVVAGVIFEGEASLRIFYGNGDGTIALGDRYPIQTISGLALADLNNDGIVDIIAEDSHPENARIAILLGDTNRHYRVVGNLRQEGSRTIVTGDLNSDGNADVVVSTSTSLAYLGKGDGTFREPITVAPRADVMALADFNRDGRLDLVCVDRNSNSVATSTGNGDGMFQDPVVRQSGTYGEAVVIDDFDRNGAQDIAVEGWDSTERSGAFTVLLNNGDGTFGPKKITRIVQESYWLMGFVSGDFDNDGWPEIVVSAPGRIVRYGPNFPPPRFPEDPTTHLRSGIARGDFIDSPDVDWWSFSAESEDRVVVAADVQGNPYAIDVNFFLTMFDVSSNIVTYMWTDALGRDDYTFILTNRGGIFRLLADGNCVSGDGSTPEYRIRVTIIPPALQVSGWGTNVLTFREENGHRTATAAGYVRVLARADKLEWPAYAESHRRHWFDLGTLPEGQAIELKTSKPADSPLVPILSIYKDGVRVAGGRAGESTLGYSVPPGRAGKYLALLTSTDDSGGLQSQYVLNIDMFSVPQLRVTRDARNVILNWNAAGSDNFILEASNDLSAGWTTVLAAPSTVGSDYFVTNAVGDASTYYRLHKR
jgi:hypothetical protein